MAIKKKTAAGVAAAGAAAVAITGATFASFSDDESATDRADAGSLNLKVGESASSHNGYEDMAPGDEVTITYTFTNDGSLDGTLKLSGIDVTSDERGLIEPERDVEDDTAGAGNGELGDMLEADLTLKQGNDVVDSWDNVTLSQLDGATYASGYDLASQESLTLVADVEFPDDGPDDNKAQTDSVDIGWNVTLAQQQ